MRSSSHPAATLPARAPRKRTRRCTMTRMAVLATSKLRPSALAGVLFMCLGVALFPFLNASAKLLTHTYPVTEVVWARFAGHLVWVALLFLPRRGWRLYRA